jgi:hypothetical protein
MIKEADGIRIKTFPDKIVIGALTQAGVLSLDFLAKSDRDNCSYIRNKFDISESEYPFWSVKQMIDGTIFMVTFTKTKQEEKKNDIQS